MNQADHPDVSNGADRASAGRSESEEIRAHLNAVFDELSDDRSGVLVDYIPELTKVDADAFAISIATIDGTMYGVGDIDARFTLQSVASPFVYGHVLEEFGPDFVRQRVGVEPTGNAFNSIVLDRRTRRPMNPMVNAGAIAISSLVEGNDPTERLNVVLELFSKFMGKRPEVDMEVFMSERSTGDRNRAIAYLMRNFGSIEGDIDEVLDLYFQQCSLLA